MACAPSTVCGRSASFRRAARQTRARAASISVCMSASFCWIAPKPPIGAPKARRSWAYAAARSSAAWAMPTAWAAIPIRPASSVERAMRMPGAASPSSSPGVRSRARSAVEDEFRPIFSSSRVARKPVAPRRTTKADGRPPAAASRAKTTKTWACEPLVIHCLLPVISPSSAARVRIAPASEPASGSVSAKAASSWPWASGGTNRSTCSDVPWRRIGSVPALVCTATVTPTPGVGARELLEHEDVGEEVGARAAVLGGHAHAHQPELAELGEDLLGEGVLAIPGRGARGDLLVGEAARQGADLALLVAELEAHRRPRRDGPRAPPHERREQDRAAPPSAAGRASRSA